MASKSKKARASVKASFSDFQWTYCIIFLVECDEISNSFISSLNETEIFNKSIRVIKKQEVLNDLRQNSKPSTPATNSSRGKSPKKPAQNEAVGDEQLKKDEQNILNLLKSSKDQYINLPPDSLANIVKQFINKLKVRFLENNSNSSGKKSGKITANTKSKKGADKEGSKKSADSKKSGNSKEKHKSVLEKVEKPQLPQCLIFTGFYEPLLPVEMAKIGLPVRAIGALKKRSVSSFENDLQLGKGALNLTSKKFNFDFYKFWSYSDPEETTMLKTEDIADIDLELPEQIAVVFDNPKRGKGMPANIKKDLKVNINKYLTNLTTHLLYCIDVYNQYLSNIDTYDLEAEYKPLSEAEHYLYLSCLLPQECSDVDFVVYNMVDQVSVWHNDKIEDNSVKNRKLQLKKFPKIINYNNKVDLKTFHLCKNDMEYDIGSVLQNYLSLNPVFNSWKVKNDKITRKQEELHNFHLRRLYKFGEGMEQYLFDLYLHWYILCRMKLEINSKEKSLKGKGLKKVKEQTACSYLSRNRLFRDSTVIRKDTKPLLKVEKWRRFSCMSVKHVNALRKENLNVLKKFIEIPEIVELVQKEKIVEKLVSNDDDSLYKYVEDLSPICLLLTVQKFSSSFLICDRLHFKPSNKILVWFHNDVGVTSRKDRFKVDSFLGFRDFYKNNLKEGSIWVSDLNEEHKEFPSRSSIKSAKQDSLGFEMENKTDLSNVSQNCEPSKKKVCNLWGSEMDLETSRHSFVSEDSSSVVLEIDHWLNMTRTMKIKIKKRNAELIYYKNMLQTYNEEQESSIYSNAVLNLPDEIRVCVDIEEKYLPNRFLKLFYTFSITLPSGLNIRVVKTDDDYYVKQKYVFQNTLNESIKREKYRCYLKAGHVIIFYKNDKVRVLYSNGEIVDCDGIVNNTQNTSVNGTDYTNVTRKSEENKGNMVENEKKAVKKDLEKQKIEKKNEVTEKTSKKNGVINEKTPNKLKKSSEKTENKTKTDIESSNNQSTPESGSFENENREYFTVLKQSVTTAYGKRFIFENGIEKPRKPYSLRTIFQPYQTLYVDRSDGYKALYTEDGSLLSTFPDKTKISTTPYSLHNIPEQSKDLDLTNSLLGLYCRESQEYHWKDFLDEDFPDEKYAFNVFNMMTLAEHPLYARVEYNVKQCAIRITLPGGVVIYVLENLNDFIVDVDSRTTVVFSKENIVFSCGLLKSSKKANITVINSVSKTIGLSKQAQKPPVFCKTIDSFGKTFLIDNNGAVELIDSPSSKDSLELITTNTAHLARDFYFQEQIPRSEFERFFVVSPDFSGHEFVHEGDVDRFLLENQSKLKREIANPICGELKSQTIQYPLFENYFQRFIIPYTDLESYYFPDYFLKCILSKPLSLENSLWLFNADVPIGKLNQTKFSQFKKKDDREPVAIVYRTLNEICLEHDNQLKKIAIILLRYEERNNKLFCLYSRRRFNRRQILDKLLGNLDSNKDIT